jgi:DHA3 family macrolide efflux protein-like MFS transporter
MTSEDIQLENKNWKAPFFTIWTGQAFSLLGSQLVGFALIWWLTKETGSATVLATASLVGLVPQVILGPLVGTLVDRWNRRMVMISADSIIALATLVLAALFWVGHMQFWYVYILMFIRSVAGGFHYASMQASTSLMVPKEHLARIQGMNQMLNGGMNIISAPLGALLLEMLPLQGVLAIDITTALIAVVPLFFIVIPQPVRTMAAAGVTAKTSVWAEMRQGLKYAFSWPGLVIIGIVATLINFLLTPAFSLLPILVTKHFNGQALQLAWMESAFGVGVLLGGLLLSVWGGFKRRMYTSIMGVFGIGIASLIVGLLPPTAFPLAVAALFLSGLANPIANGPLFAALQASVDPEMQGRIFTLIGSVASAMSPLGLIAAGPVADHLGVQTWFLMGGVVTILMALTMFPIPAVVHFEDGHPQHKMVVSAPTVLPVPSEATQD